MGHDPTLTDEDRFRERVRHLYRASGLDLDTDGEDEVLRHLAGFLDPADMRRARAVLQEETMEIPTPNGTCVYIAHPFMGDGKITPEQNYEHYLQVVAAAMRAGFTVLSWAFTVEIERRGLVDFPPRVYVDFDLPIVRKSDELWVAAGNQDSTGMRREANEAACHGITLRVVTLLDDGTLHLSDPIVAHSIEVARVPTC